MKVNEMKLILKIKELAKGILTEYPQNSNAKSIIALCDIVDCDSTYIPGNATHMSQIVEDGPSFDEAVKEQHG